MTTLGTVNGAVLPSVVSNDVAELERRYILLDGQFMHLKERVAVLEYEFCVAVAAFVAGMYLPVVWVLIGVVVLSLLFAYTDGHQWLLDWMRKVWAPLAVDLRAAREFNRPEWRRP
jgi:hypothetical protein